MSEYINEELKRQVYSRFNSCCAYCLTANALMPVTFECEHIIPRSVGGKTVFENLCLACPMCNRYKSNRQQVIDPQTQNTVSIFHPHLQKWTEHFAWNEAFTEIIGLTPIDRATIVTLKMNRPELIRVRRMWVKMGEHPPSLE
ncbi:HNH endonuclease [Aliterella atlantica]|uniref:HNH endonuclease n=1 Tax=Aliterella atlantica CENA595 TaxID=1618023 RepID=A0A0D8ZRL8_9CYAN|nr:HNH endonuclease [Aliterella atlantica]KJH69836.1 HNH endonuclease [Aliterella atlantica CENA595]